MNKRSLILIILFSIATGISGSLAQTMPPIELRFAMGMVSHEPFGEIELNNVSYKMNLLSAEAGVEVWIKRAISVGIIKTYGKFNNVEFFNQSLGDTENVDYSLSHTIVRARFSTQQQKFLSVYASAGYQITNVYYEKWNLGRSASGPIAGAGLNLKIGRLRLNPIDMGVGYMSNHLFTDALDNKLIISFKSGLAIRIIDPL